MAVTYKDIGQLTRKASIAGTEKIPVSETEYITPNQVVSAETSRATTAEAQLQSAIQSLTAQAFVVVSTLPAASASTLGKIYLIPNTNDSTYKDEYVTFQDGNTYSWAQIGTTELDLSGVPNLSYLGETIETNVIINI